MKKLLLLLFSFYLTIPLVNAQAFQWAKSQPNNTNGTSIAASSNFLAVTGQFHNTIVLGSNTFTSPDSLNSYLASYDFAGNVLWAKQIISHSLNRHAVTVDQNQNIIVTGTFRDSLYIGSLQFKSPVPKGQAVFVAKFNAAGSLLWARSSAISSTLQTGSTSVSSDGIGNIFLAGSFTGNLSFGATSIPGNFGSAFLVKYDQNGLLQWANNAGNSGMVSEVKVKTSNNGDIYFAVLRDSPIAYLVGIHVVRINTSGTVLWDATAGTGMPFNSNNFDITFDITTDNANNAYLIGNNARGVILTDANNFLQVPKTGPKGLFMAKINPLGKWKWAKSIAFGNYSDQALSIFYSSNNTLTFSASFTGSAFVYPNLPFSSTPANSINSFIANLDTAGTVVWTSIVNGTNQSSDITGDTNRNFYVSGTFTGNTNFDTHTLTNVNTESYLAKIADNSNKVTGTLFVDANGNGLKDTGELPFENGIVEITPGPRYAGSENNGKFTAYLTGGNYNLQVAQPANHYTFLPQNHSVSFTGLGQTQTKDFALVPIPNRNDVKVTVTNLTPARPGFKLKYRITYQNVGTTTLSDTITLKYASNSLTYTSASTAPASQQAGKLRWFYQPLQPTETRNIDVEFTVAASTPINTKLNALAVIKPLATDFIPGNNTDSLNQVVTGSFDPNDKQVSFTKLTPAQVASGKLLDYVIRFQNTGNDTAFTLIVRDSISSKLHMPSFELLSASHPYTFRLLDNGMAEWRFSNILLPDSGRNEPASHGFIRYRMKPKNNLVLGDEIKSRAAIYFDYNAPVHTNYAVTRIANLTGFAEDKAGDKLKLYPNPAKQYVMVEAYFKQNTAATIFLMNMLGQTLQKETLVPQQEIHYQMNLNNLAKGVYLIRLETETGTQTQRLVIQ